MNLNIEEIAKLAIEENSCLAINIHVINNVEVVSFQRIILFIFSIKGPRLTP